MRLLLFIPAIICLVVAGMLVIEKGRDFGWFLFVGLLLTFAAMSDGNKK